MSEFKKLIEQVLKLDKNMSLIRTSSMDELDSLTKISDTQFTDYYFTHMYTCSHAIIKKMTTVVNAVFTQRRQTFLLSRNSLMDLLKNDVNHDLGMSPNEYRKFIFYMIESKYFEVLRKGTNRKASVYKLVQPKLVEALHKLAAKDYFETQEDLVLSYYDDSSTDKSVKFKTFKSLSVEERAAQNRDMINELKKELGNPRIEGVDYDK